MLAIIICCLHQTNFALTPAPPPPSTRQLPPSASLHRNHAASSVVGVMERKQRCSGCVTDARCVMDSLHDHSRLNNAGNENKGSSKNHALKSPQASHTPLVTELARDKHLDQSVFRLSLRIRSSEIVGIVLHDGEKRVPLTLQDTQ
ncbi:hypothetical protein E2C01_025242 [Portunus trituberculatus]|uniref:Uncharacterized protein n=1 Tax=Portunus trituberculatus TaxID=210409 RepID=A0A5B7ECU4_PORTR|nr:hypothetical protein [Portunus trituberculatus]